jgi:hypothetical protein
VAQLSETRTFFRVEISEDKKSFHLAPRKYSGEERLIDAGLQLLRDMELDIPAIRFECEAGGVLSASDIIVPRAWIAMLMDLFQECGAIVAADRQLLSFETKTPFVHPAVEAAFTKSDAEKVRDKFSVNYSGQRPFCVVEPGWASVDGWYFGDHLVSDFGNWCRTRHSLGYRLGSAGAAEGGFSLPDCPGYRLAYEYGHESRSDVRGTRDYRGRKLTPYWAMAALREAMFDFGVASKSEDDSGFWNPLLDE